MWVLFVTGVGINLSPLYSTFIWACVRSRFERFLMYRLFVSCFFLINIAPQLFSPFMAFDSADYALIRGFSLIKVIRRHKGHIGIRFTFFSLVWRSNIISLSSFILFWIFSIFSTWSIVFGSETAICALSLDCFASEHFLGWSCLIPLTLILFSL